MATDKQSVKVDPMTQIPNISFSDALWCLRIARAASVPTLLWGPPGIGKSSLVNMLPRFLRDGNGDVLKNQKGEPVREPMVTLIGSISDPTEIMGFPSKNEQTGSIEFAPRQWVVDIITAGSGVVFLDELTTCPPAVQNALLRLVLDRVAGDLTLPMDTYIVAAANAVRDIMGGNDLTPPMANRFAHFVVNPSMSNGPTLKSGVDSFIRAMTRSWDAVYEHIPTEVKPYPETTRLAVKNTILSYLNGSPGSLTVADVEHGVLAFPTPRIWDAVLRVSAFINPRGSEDEARIADHMFTSLVGRGIAGELQSHFAKVELPDPYEVLKDPRKLPTENTSVMFATTMSCMNILHANQDNPTKYMEAWAAVGGVFEHLKENRYKEIAMAFLQEYCEIWPKLPTKGRPKLDVVLGGYRDEIKRLKTAD